MPEKTRKCRHKSQTTMPFTQNFVRSQTKQKVIAHEDCQEFSFLYRRTLKQMKQKRSSGNVVHFFFATFGTSTSSFEETAPDAAPDKEKMALHQTLQPNKNAVILKTKKRRLQLPKSRVRSGNSGQPRVIPDMKVILQLVRFCITYINVDYHFNN